MTGSSYRAYRLVAPLAVHKRTPLLQVSRHWSLVLTDGERPVVRSEYFSGFDEALDQLVFIDPDTGFEPSKCEECHVAYRDVSRVLEQLNDNSIISVFQYQRRKSFSDDLASIRARLGDCHSTALYRRSLMFVSIAKSPRMIETIGVLNQKYATRRERVYVIP